LLTDLKKSVRNSFLKKIQPVQLFQGRISEFIRWEEVNFVSLFNGKIRKTQSQRGRELTKKREYKRVLKLRGGWVKYSDKR